MGRHPVTKFNAVEYADIDNLDLAISTLKATDKPMKLLVISKDIWDIAIQKVRKTGLSVTLSDIDNTQRKYIHGKGELCKPILCKSILRESKIKRNGLDC